MWRFVRVSVCNMGCKSVPQRRNLCVRSDTVDGYCLVLLLGTMRVTLWCNRGHEHISHLPRPYKKEKPGHSWGEGMCPASPLTPVPVSLHFVTAPTRSGQHWRHDPFPPQTMAIVKFTVCPPQLFPVFVGLLPLGGYEWTQRPGVPPLYRHVYEARILTCHPGRSARQEKNKHCC